MYLIGFCLVFSGLNLLFFRIKNKAFNLQQITIPAHIQIKEDPYFGQDKKRAPILDYYLDSLSSTVSGKRILDSLNLLRPGLLDSFRIFKNNINHLF
ncbi:hypothetical protein [Arachidicoccus soli]|uniref:Uncharacterized protein n=1 Tax=Arachidicoccus soli TaxID=2341117 RepID=A0A386HND5_9BACT|nr:hypothetical protein [Arachidicoccus soli]AYD47428.1 hypothetical protein D6B99_07285 [Arachidicoccus soli]